METKGQFPNSQNYVFVIFVMQLKTQWGEKYQRWMVQTEQKIEELQAANNFL